MDNSGATTQTPQGNSVNNGNGTPDKELTERELRYKQQMEGSKQEASRLAQEKTQEAERANKYKEQLLKTDYKRVYRNNTFNAQEFQEIFTEDPAHAEELAWMFLIDGKPASASQIMQAYGNKEPNIQQKWIDPEELKRQLREEILWEVKKEKIGSIVESQFSQLPANLQAVAKEKYNLLTTGRTLTESEVWDFVRMAVTLAQAEVPQNKDMYVANQGAMPIGGNIGLNPMQTHDPNKISDDDYKEVIREAFWMFRGSEIGNTLANIHNRL